MKLLNCFLILITFLLTPFFCYGQEKLRSVDKIPLLNEPIELTGLKVQSKPFDVENQVVADNDWLKTLSLDLKNISGKTIVHMQLEVEVAVTGKMQYPLRLPLEFGKIPSVESPKNTVVETTIVRDTLKPNKTVTISLRPKIYDFLLQFMQKNEIEDIEQIKLFLEFVVFEDGTAWSKGQEMRRNSKNPDQWDVVGEWDKKISKFENRFAPKPNFQCGQEVNDSSNFRLTRSIFNLPISSERARTRTRRNLKFPEIQI